MTVDEQIAAHLRRFEGERDEGDSLDDRIKRFLLRAKQGELIRRQNAYFVGDVVGLKGSVRRVTIVKVGSVLQNDARCAWINDSGDVVEHNFPTRALFKFDETPRHPTPV